MSRSRIAIISTISLFSLFLSGQAIPGGRDRDVLLRSGRLHVPADRRAAFDQARARGLAPAFHALVAFDDVPDAAAVAALKAAGVRLLGYLPHNTWRASLPSGLDPDDPRLAPVRGIVIPGPADKIDARLKGRAGPEPLGALVVFHDDTPPAGRLGAVGRHGGDVVARLRSLPGLVVRLPGNAVAALASEDEVAWVEEAPPMLGPTNDGVRSGLAVEGVWTDPIQGLVGTGVDVLVFDQGRVDDTHVDLAGRVVVGDAVAVSNHSTHVAGTLSGAGTASGGLYSGVAPDAGLITYALGSYNAGIFLYSNPGDLEANFSYAIGAHGADLANLSLGSNLKLNNYPCDIHGDYGVTDALLDAIVGGSLGVPFPVVVAGGNERPSPACGLSYATTAPPAGAKNILSIGAVNSNDDTMASFSAWGPTDDGRIKPDLVAPGCQVGGDGTVTSTIPTNAYGGYCGTSQAAPSVTGLLALLIEDARARSLPDPSPASLRALLYHTALDLGTAGPDYRFGYGKPRPRLALDTYRSGAVRVSAVTDGQTMVVPVEVTDPNAPFIATLAWDDPPASAGAAVALVNDLDLRVVDPSGARHYVWTLDPADPGAPAVRTRDDHVNNMEQVTVDPAGAAGIWRVEVNGSAVVAGPQSYSLVVTAGGNGVPSGGYVLTDRRAYRCADTMTVEVTEPSLTGAGSTDVTVASTSDPNGIVVSLVEQAGAGLFSGPVAMGAQIPVAHGDVVSIAHPVSGATTAAVDCVPPVLTDASITMVDSRSARVSWLTDEPADTRVEGAVVSHAPTLSHAGDLPGLSACTPYGTQIASADEAGNLGTAPPLPFETRGETVRFFDDLESGATGWQNPAKGGGSNPVQWLLTTSTSASPTHAWTDSAGGSYRDNTQNLLITPPVDLTGARRVLLRLSQKYAMEEGFDYGYVDYSLDGSGWIGPVAAFTGITAGFVTSRVPLPPGVENQPQVFLRFRLETDNSLSFDGWYIDDVEVVSRDDCSEVENLTMSIDPTSGAPRLSWDESPGASTYDIFRGELPMAGIYGPCLATQVTGATYEDQAGDPALSYFYLVAGKGGAGQGTIGYDSGGVERLAEACP